MTDNTQNAANVSLGIAGTSSIMNILAENATAISVLCTLCFGVIYVICAVWNAYSNWKRNKVSEESALKKAIEKLPDELAQQVKDHMGY